MNVKNLKKKETSKSKTKSESKTSLVPAKQ